MMNLSILFQNKIYFFSILFLAALLITIPRFNKREAGMSSLTNKTLNNNFDSDEYVNMVKYFRGNLAPGDKLDPPYTYRILVPLMAAPLPFNPITSINLLSVLAIFLSVYLLEKILTILNFDTKYKFAGSLLYIISFPVFYYSVTGNLDTVLLLVFFLSEYLILKKKYSILLLVVFWGTFIKETVLLVIILAFINMLLDKEESKKTILIYSFINAAAFLLGTYISRKVIPVTSTYIWKPSFDLIIMNLTRIRLYIAATLSFGIPGIFALFTAWKRKELFSSNTVPLFYFLASGFSISILLFLYSIVSAYSDGRFLWISYPFTIPLALYSIKYFFKVKQ